MSSKANVLKKFRHWLRKLEARRETVAKSPLSLQVGKLLKDRGEEIITMTTL